MTHALCLLALLFAAAAHADGPAVDVDLTAVLPTGDAAVEYWDLVGDFDSGHRLYARFLITNVGPGDHTALAFGHWVAPDGTATAFKNGRRKDDWTLSPDRKRLSIGSSVLALAPTTRHFEVDNDKRGIKIFVDIEADGTALASPGTSPDPAIDLLNLGSPARGSFWLEGMAKPRPLAGRALLTHTVATRDEGNAFTRRIDVAVLRGSTRWFLSHSVRRGGGSPQVLAVRADAGRASLLTPGVRVENPPTPASSGEYPIPAQLRLAGNGSGSVALGELQLQVDPLDALPTLLKMVYPFRRSPRHAWANVVVDVALKSGTEETVHRIEGAGIATIVHLDSSPQ